MLKVEGPSCRAARIALATRLRPSATGRAFETRRDAAATAIARAR